MRIVVSLICVLLCLLGIAKAGRAGLARMLSEKSLELNSVAAADKSVSLAPSDASGYDARGKLWLRSGRPKDAAINFERGVILRPRDYALWLHLGQARDTNGDEGGAIAAYQQAIQLAPFYAQPHWQLGNVLLREGDDKEGFEQLRRAARSDPSMLPAVIDLAWSGYEGRAAEVLQAIQPQTNPERMALGRFFVEHGCTDAALDLLRTAGIEAATDRQRLVVELIEERRYREAFSVWCTTDRVGTQTLVNDGGFEQEALSESTGFEWQYAHRIDGVRIVLDRRNAESGTNCLRFDFGGSPDSSARFLKQLVMVQPRSHYRLTFAARSTDLISSSRPLIEVLEAGVQGRLLARSENLPPGTSDWQSFSIEFATTDQTEAAYIIVQREHCKDVSCPISGQVWLDAFSLTRL